MSEETNTTEETTVTETALSRVAEFYAAFEVDYEKFAEKGTDKAAARARGALSALAKVIKLARKELQDARLVAKAAKREAKAAKTVTE
jgi:hypothetical protein